MLPAERKSLVKQRRVIPLNVTIRLRVVGIFVLSPRAQHFDDGAEEGVVHLLSLVRQDEIGWT